MTHTDLRSDYSYQPLQPHHLAHDLRGPLNSMLGFTELLLEGIEGPLNDIQIEDLTAIWQSAQNLLTLINAYIDLSRLNAGQLHLEPSPINSVEAIQLAAKEIAAIDAAVGVAVNTTVPDKLPSVMGDYSRIVQMIKLPAQFLAELIGRGTLNISAAQAGDRLNVVIATPDATLDPTQISELFEQSVRVDAAGRTRLTTGGIFLPLAYQLALRQNCQLSAANSPEAGATFSLSLPLYQPD